jgi:hypothetical protein
VSPSSTGYAGFTFSIPESTAGTHKVLIRGAKSGLKLTVNVTVKPSISASPKSVEPRTRVTVTLKGLRAGEVVDLKWYVTSRSTSTLKNDLVATSKGTIRVTFYVPSSAKNGDHKLEVRGESSSRVSVTLKVSGATVASVDEPTVPAATPLPSAVPTMTPTAIPPTPEPTSPAEPTATPEPTEEE